MHLIWHIFKKDARLMRGPLATWIGMFLTTFAIAAVIASAAGGNIWFASVHIAFATVLWLSAYFFAAIPVYEDSVAGGEAFWQSRPVSRLQLLTAKLLGLIVFFGLLPLLLRLPWWWGHGFDLGQIGLAAKETLEMSLTVVTLAFTLASVSNNGPEFYRRTLGLIGLVIIAVLWLLFTRTGNFAANEMMKGGIIGAGLNIRLTAWRGLPVTLAVCLAAIAAAQFLSPNRSRTNILVVGFILTGVFFATFPVGTLIPRRPVDLGVSAVVTHGLVEKISLTEKSRPRSFVILKKAALSAGPGSQWRIPIDWGYQSLQHEAEYFLSSPGADGPVATYDIFPEKNGLPSGVHDLTFQGEGEIWRQEYVLSVPLAEGQEVTQGSRRLRVDGLRLGEAHGTTVEAIRGRLVLTEILPVLAEDANVRPEMLSEVYFLVTPSGTKRIFPDSREMFISSNVGVRTSLFPIGADQLGRRPDGNLGSADSARVVKIGFYRVGWFQETLPVSLAAGEAKH